MQNFRQKFLPKTRIHFSRADNGDLGGKIPGQGRDRARERKRESQKREIVPIIKANPAQQCCSIHARFSSGTSKRDNKLQRKFWLALCGFQNGTAFKTIWRKPRVLIVRYQCLHGLLSGILPENWEAIFKINVNK